MFRPKKHKLYRMFYKTHLAQFLCHLSYFQIYPILSLWHILYSGQSNCVIVFIKYFQADWDVTFLFSFIGFLQTYTLVC